VTGAAMKVVFMPKAIATTTIAAASKMNMRIEASSPLWGNAVGHEQSDRNRERGQYHQCG
jgi:hypothetical protein